MNKPTIVTMYNEVIKSFYKNKDPQKSLEMSKYMKNKFPYLGIPKPARVLLQKEFFKEEKKKNKIDWNLVFDLYGKKEREFQYLAIDYLIALKSILIKEDIKHIEKLIVTKSWWDTVDALDSLVGVLLAKYPKLIAKIDEYIKSDNIWLKRISIDCQLAFKENTNTEILSRAILGNLGTKEFFINKAIGWSLREYSKTNQKWVQDFIDKHKDKMDKLSVREASKYL